MNNNPETKLCRHCRSEMDVKATVCPNCHKSQRRGKGCIIALIIAVIFIGIPKKNGKSELAAAVALLLGSTAKSNDCPS